MIKFHLEFYRRANFFGNGLEKTIFKDIVFLIATDIELKALRIDTRKPFFLKKERFPHLPKKHF